MSDSVDLADLERKLREIGRAISSPQATLPEEIAKQRRINADLKELLSKIEDAKRKRKP